MTDVGPSDHHSYPIPTEGIADGAVTDAKVASGISESKISYDTAAGHNHDGTNSRRVSHTSLLDITADSHHPYPVPTDGIGDSAVTTSKIADGAVTRVKIADGAVDSSKIASDPASLNLVTGGNARVSDSTVEIDNLRTTTSLDLRITSDSGHWAHYFDPGVLENYSWFYVRFHGRLPSPPSAITLSVLSTENVDGSTLTVIETYDHGFVARVTSPGATYSIAGIEISYSTSAKVVSVDSTNGTADLLCDCGTTTTVSIADDLSWVTERRKQIVHGDGTNFSVVVSKREDEVIDTVESIVNKTSGETYTFSSIGDDGVTINFTGNNPPASTDDVEVIFTVRETKRLRWVCPSCSRITVFNRPEGTPESGSQEELIEQIFSLKS